MTSTTPSSARGWTVTLAALGINLILGVLYAWGVMAKALVTDPQWHWTATQASLPFAVATGAFALMMIFAGRWQDRIGPRYVAMLGGIILGLGMVSSAFVHTPAQMVITFGLVGGLGIGLGYSATTPPAIKWFSPARKGLITGIVVSGVGLAAVYISPLTQYLLGATQSIPRTFLLLGLGAIVLVSLLSQLLVNPPADYTPAAPGAGVAASVGAQTARQNSDWREMLRTPQFYRLWFMFVLAAWAGLMIISQVALIAKEQAGWKWGFVPIATLALFNTSGRVVSGFLSDRIGRSRTMLVAFVLQALNMFAFSHYTTPALLVFGSAFTGLCYGTIFTLFPATTADFYGVRHLGVNYGLLFTAFGVAGVSGPIVAARIHDKFHSYGYSYTLSAIMLLVGAVLAVTLKPPRLEPTPLTLQLEPERVGAT